MLAEPATKKISLIPSWGDVPAAHDPAIRRLVLAVVSQAVDDCKHGDYLTRYEALNWLRATAPEWLEATGYGVRPSEFRELLERMEAEHLQKTRKEYGFCIGEYWQTLAGSVDLFYRRAIACLLS